MARRSQCSSAGDNPLDPNYLPPHYREEYRLAIDALVEEDLEGYYKFLQKADVVDFLSTPEIQYIQSFVHIPHQSHHHEQQHQETEGDGSSDTYWPLHSDQDVPGLDLGWPQLHRFIGPTEVTTLVNPPEPDMPSIKEQARRLIKNAQQVIAVVMDMFTDVDIFADILNAAMRSVAVYILLDEQNTDYFLNMVSNCRVNLQSIQFLRVRTVSGITYHCRSGKSFKGQMMDRFLLTDCRAVLSGNYSFMWSFEKLHRCMAHLFLGQLVSTFDEEFRILFAQSQPLMFENPIEDFSPFQKRQYPSEITSLYREPRKFLPLDSEERTRHSFDERMDADWRMMHLKRQEPQHSPADVYSKFPSQQPRMDSPYDQGPFRVSLLENSAFKRHSYAEGVQGRYSYPHLQPQGMPEPEIQGRQFHRGHKPLHGSVQGPEADYSGYDKLWGQDYLSDQYSESGLPQEMQPLDHFDPVLNYLSSTRNVDFDQSSEKLVPEPDLPFSSSQPKGLSLGPYACQTSPTASNTTEQKLLQESNVDRKDPKVKRGLRNWRISSYLSTYDNPGDEGLPFAPTQTSEPFEEPSNPLPQTTPGTDLSFPKIPNVREFKVPAVPRASQIPCYSKNTVREKPKKLPDELPAVAPEVKTTPTPSESSSTAEGEKAEDAEQRNNNKEPKESKNTPLLREESFRSKFSATPRGSRLRSSLIFSSLDQQHAPQDTKAAQGQPDEENDKNEAEQTKLPFVSHVLGQRRSTTREPFAWSRYIKSTTFDNSTTEITNSNDENSKAANGELSKIKNSKDNSDNSTVDKVEESLKQLDVEQANSSPSVPKSKPSETKLPKTDQPVQAPPSLLTTPSFVDMSDPKERLMFFKELAAQRKAAEAKKSNDKAQMKPVDQKTSTTLEKNETDIKRTLEKIANISQSDSVSEKHITTNVAGETRNPPVSDKEMETCQPTASLPVSTEAEPSQCEPLKDLKLSKPALNRSDFSHPPASTKATLVNVLSPEQGTNRGEIPKQHSLVKNDVSTSQSCKEEEVKKSAVSENNELGTSQPTKYSPIAETEPPSNEDLKLSKPAEKESSLTHPPTSTNTIHAKVPSSEQGPHGSGISKQYNLVKNTSTSQRCKDVVIKISTDSEEELETSQPTPLSVADKTEPPQPEALKNVMLSKPAVKESSLSHPPSSTNAAPVNVSSPEQGSNETQIANQDSFVNNDSEKELEINQPTTSLPVAIETGPPAPEPLKDLMLSKPAEKDSSLTLLTTPSFVDMSDPKERLMFFKELAAQRKAAEAKKSNDKAQMKPVDQKTSITLEKNETDIKRTLEKMANISQSDSLSEKHITTNVAGETLNPPVSDKEMETCQPTASLPVSTEAEPPQCEPLKDLKLSKPALNRSDLSHPPASTKATLVNVLSPEQGINRGEIPKQPSLVKNDVSTSQSCKEEQVKTSAVSENKKLVTSQPTKYFPTAETEPPSNEDLKLSKPAEKESSLTLSSTPLNTTPTNVQSPDQDPNGSQIPKQDSLDKNDASTSQSFKDEQTKISTNPEKELETSQPTTLPAAAETQPPPPEPLKDLMLSKPAVKENGLTLPSTSTNTTPTSVPPPEQGPNGSQIPKQDGLVKNDASTSQICKMEQAKISNDQEKELETSQTTTSLPVAAETEPPQPEPLKDLMLSKPAVKENSLIPTSTNITPTNVPAPEQGPNGSQIPKQDGPVTNDASISHICKMEQAKISSDQEKELETSQTTTTSLPVAAETEPPQPEPLKDLMQSNPAEKESSLTPTSTNITPTNVPAPDQGPNGSQIPKQDGPAKNDSEKELEISQSATSIFAEREPHPLETLKDFIFSKPVVNDNCISPTSTPGNVTTAEQGPDESETLSCDSPSKESSSLIPSSLKEPLSSVSAPLDFNNQKAESAELQTVIPEPAPLPEQMSGSKCASSNTSIQSSTPCLLPTHPGSQIIPSLPNSSSAPHSSPEDTLSNVTTDDSSSPSSTLASNILSPSSDKTEAPEPVSSSSPESSHTADGTCKELTEPDCTQACLQPVSQLTSPEIPPAVDSAKLESEITPDTCLTLIEPNTVSLQCITKTNSSEFCALTPSESIELESGNNSAPKAVLKESKVLSSSEDVKSDIKPPDLSPTSHMSNFADASNLELSTSRPDQSEVSAIHLPPEDFPSGTSSPANLDITANAPHSTANACQKDAQKQAVLQSELYLAGIVSPAPVETVSHSYPLTDSDGSHFPPEAKKAETNMSTSSSPSETPSLPKQITKDLNQTPPLPSTETSSPTEPTSKISTEPEPTPDCVTSESHAPEPSEPAEKSEKDQQNNARKDPELSDSGNKKAEDTNKISVATKESVVSEKTNVQVKAINCSDKAANQVISPLSQSKQPKPSQSRYQSSTANVLSSSNLRDDTKLLLEQISANSLSRNEATKDSPVTDDEKEDKADKNAKRETEKFGTLGSGQPKSLQEREKLLERIQTMRKERKVYSRFEMAP